MFLHTNLGSFCKRVLQNDKRGFESCPGRPGPTSEVNLLRNTVYPATEVAGLRGEISIFGTFTKSTLQKKCISFFDK